MPSKNPKEQRTFDLLCEQIIRRLSREPTMVRDRLSAGLACSGEGRVRALEEIVQRPRGNKLTQKIGAALLAEMCGDASAGDILSAIASAPRALACAECRNWERLGICRCCGKELCRGCREGHVLATRIIRELAREQDRAADRQRVARRLMRESLRR